MTSSTNAAAYNREYYARNCERIKQTERERYQADSERIRARNRVYAAAHKEEIAQRRSQYWRETRKDKERQLWNTPSGRANKLVRTARAMARPRGLSFGITSDDVRPSLQRGTCDITGLPFDMTSTRGPWRPSLDRIDSSRGYEPGNVQVVVWLYNAAKQQYSHADVLVLANALVAGVAS